MEWRNSVLALVLFAGLCVGPIAANEYGEGNAHVRLVRSAATVGAETTFLLGVEFDIRPGWHIYWRNPGGAGLATEIRWQIPEPFVAGDLQWPLPIGFTQSGDIPGYGYEKSVVLAAEIRSKAGILDRQIVGANVSWLACKDVCVLGSAKLENELAALPVSAVFEEWPGDLPRKLDSENPVFTLTTRGGPADGNLGLWLQWRQTPRFVEWYPDPPEGLEVTGVTTKTRGGLTRIDCGVRRMQGSSGTTNTLNSVVVMTDNNGVRRGWNLAVDIGRE